MEERRQASRIDSLNLVHVTCWDENGRAVRQGIGRTINVSEKGILLETHFEVDADEKYEISIGLEDQIVDIRAHVVHLQHGEKDRSLVGLSFGDLDEESLSKLRGFIRRFNEHQDAAS